jgi:radical SAM superfamily enzyme YgiQ (UPF0313 family)
MKVLFVIDDYVIDPLGVSWLAAYLLEAGHDVGLKILEGEVDWQDVLDDPPDMLCYSVTTGKHGYYQSVNAGLRMTLKQDVVSVFGGPHVTFFPEYINGKYMDIGVRGEGFETIVDIANALRDQSSLSNIPNTVIDGKINPLRPLINKDNMLYPYRDIIYRRAKNRDNPIKNVMASLGCLYSCPYCSSQEYKRLYDIHRAEIRPVGEVMGEIEDLLRFPLGLIYFNDDIFPIYDKEWLAMFCDEYPKFCEKPFHIQVRAEFITDDIIKRLKSVGLHGVTFAIESGNSVLRRQMLKRRMSDDQILDAADILHKYDVKLRTENMVGIPGETWETAMQTLDLNVRCKPTIAWASLFQPYPGTELGDFCAEKGLFDGNLNDISESFFDTYRLDVPNAKRYEKLQKLFSCAANNRLTRGALPLLTRLPLSYKETYSHTKAKLYKQLYKVA